MEMPSELSHHHDHDHGANADGSTAAASAPQSPAMIAAAAAAHMDAAASAAAAAAGAPIDHEEIDEDVHGVASPSHSPSSSSAHDPASVAANAIDMKKTGRPVHPLWAHFHRGEKRNRYHYHAFCIYCVARYGPEHVPPTRGVSIDMLRHVEKCTNCPRKVVESVKDICGRRDAVRFDRYLKKKSDSGDDPLSHHHHEDDEHNATGDDGGVAGESARLLQQQQQQQQQHDGAVGVGVEQTHAERIRQQHAEYQRNVQLRHQQQQQQQQQEQQRQQLLHEQQQQQQFQLQQQQQQQELEKSQGREAHADAGNGEVSGENPNASSHIDLTGSGNSSSTPTSLNRSADSMSAANAGAHGTTGAAAAATTAAALNHGTSVAGGVNTARLLGKHALRTTGFDNPNRGHHQQHTPGDIAHGDNSNNNSGSLSAKRARTSSPADKWKTNLLKTAVTAGLPFQAFQNAEFQELMRYLHPSATATTPAPGSSESTLNHLTGITDPKFLSEAAGRLALVQLDRVKEGMHNSTIKGGLTLSVNCWFTLDLQQLVAFTLVNSNGDAACVCVIDMGTQANAYSSTQLAVKIEDVLQKLEELHICVMGIVADSIIALNAARCVCFAEKRKALLVVPCFTRQLSVLAGSLLTHELFSDAVGQMIEIASYFSNASLQNVLKLVSGDDDARIPMPNRANWYSFLDCISAMLKYCDVVTAICTEADSSGGAGGDGSSGEVASVAPQRLKELVFAEEGKLWKTLQELNTLLLPLKETYVLVFQHKLKGSHTDNDGVGDSGRSSTTTTNENDFFVAAHGLTLAHIMYQLARMNQQYAGLVGTHHERLAQMMQTRINVTWQHYDLPVMVLAYVFNFHLDTGLLNMETCEAFQWETIAAYFQEYFSTWFHDKSAGGGLLRPSHPGSSAPETTSTSANSSTASSGANNASNNPVLGPISGDKVHEIFSAYKLNQFPFDADTTSDYVDVSSFYSFVSDSHPEICALCCRMYAISLLSANVQRIVRGIGYVPTTTQTVKSPETVELLLHIGFASSMKKVERNQQQQQSEPNSSTSSNNSNSNSSNAIAGLSTVMGGCHPDEVFWNEDVWNEFSSDWRQFLELELAMDEFDAITEHAHAANSGSSSTATNGSSISRVSEMISRKVPLDEVFVGTLAPLSTSGASSSTTTTVTNPADHDDAVLSMEM